MVENPLTTIRTITCHKFVSIKQKQPSQHSRFPRPLHNPSSLKHTVKLSSLPITSFNHVQTKSNSILHQKQANGATNLCCPRPVARTNNKLHSRSRNTHPQQQHLCLNSWAHSTCAAPQRSRSHETSHENHRLNTFFITYNLYLEKSYNVNTRTRRRQQEE